MTKINFLPLQIEGSDEKVNNEALGGWLNWLEHHSAGQKVAGLIPIRKHKGGSSLMFLSHTDVSSSAEDLKIMDARKTAMNIHKF